MVSSLYNVLWECIVVHFDWSLHVMSSGTTYVQNFRPVYTYYLPIIIYYEVCCCLHVK